MAPLSSPISYKEHILLWISKILFLFLDILLGLLKNLSCLFNRFVKHISLGKSQCLYSCFQYYYVIEHFLLTYILYLLLYYHNSNIGNIWGSHPAICCFPWLLNIWELNSLCICNSYPWDHMRLIWNYRDAIGSGIKVHFFREYLPSHLLGTLTTTNPGLHLNHPIV